MEEIIKYNQSVLVGKLFKLPDAYINLKNHCNHKNKIKNLI